MLEYLMGYVDEMEKGFEQQGANQVHKNTQMVDSKYQTLLDMKKFILEDMVIRFIDDDIREIQSMIPPTRNAITTMMDKWMGICGKYPAYIDRKKIRDYIVGQMVQEE